jgi:transposase InsO family protein
VIHSDQGTQFTSWAFTQRAVESGLLPSMGSKGDCYDCEENGVVVRLVSDPCLRLAGVPWR